MLGVARAEPPDFILDCLATNKTFSSWSSLLAILRICSSSSLSDMSVTKCTSASSFFQTEKACNLEVMEVYNRLVCLRYSRNLIEATIPLKSYFYIYATNGSICYYYYYFLFTNDFQSVLIAAFPFNF